MDPTGWPAGHEIQAVSAEVGKCIPEETTLPPEVSAARAALQPPARSWYGALQVIVSDTAWGTETADVWYLGCYGSVFSTQAGTQLLTNDSHGDPVQHTSQTGHQGRKIHSKDVVLLSVIWKGRWRVGKRQRYESPERGPHSNVKPTVFSSVVRRKPLGKSNWALCLSGKTAPFNLASHKYWLFHYV